MFRIGCKASRSVYRNSRPFGSEKITDNFRRKFNQTGQSFSRYNELDKTHAVCMGLFGLGALYFSDDARVDRFSQCLVDSLQSNNRRLGIVLSDAEVIAYADNSLGSLKALMLSTPVYAGLIRVLVTRKPNELIANAMKKACIRAIPDSLVTGITSSALYMILAQSKGLSQCLVSRGFSDDDARSFVNTMTCLVTSSLVFLGEWGTAGGCSCLRLLQASVGMLGIFLRLYAGVFNPGFEVSTKTHSDAQKPLLSQQDLMEVSLFAGGTTLATLLINGSLKDVLSPRVSKFTINDIPRGADLGKAFGLRWVFGLAWAVSVNAVQGLPVSMHVLASHNDD